MCRSVDLELRNAVGGNGGNGGNGGERFLDRF